MISSGSIYLAKYYVCFYFFTLLTNFKNDEYNIITCRYKFGIYVFKRISELTRHIRVYKEIKTAEP